MARQPRPEARPRLRGWGQRQSRCPALLTFILGCVATNRKRWGHRMDPDALGLQFAASASESISFPTKSGVAYPHSQPEMAAEVRGRVCLGSLRKTGSSFWVNRIRQECTAASLYTRPQSSGPLFARGGQGVAHQQCGCSDVILDGFQCCLCQAPWHARFTPWGFPAGNRYWNWDGGSFCPLELSPPPKGSWKPPSNTSPGSSMQTCQAPQLGAEG